jgi:hypothetical protein
LKDQVVTTHRRVENPEKFPKQNYFRICGPALREFQAEGIWHLHLPEVAWWLSVCLAVCSPARNQVDMSELKEDPVATSSGEEDGVAASREGLNNVNLPAAVVESLENGAKNDGGDGGCGGGDAPPLTSHPPPLPPSGNATDDADVAAASSSGAAAAAADIAPSPHSGGGGAVGGGSDTACTTNNPSTSSDNNGWMVVGARCSIPKRGSGTVRWKGVIGTKDRVGVDLDEPNGLNDGSTPSGIVLFRCKPMHGVFVLPSIVEQPAAVTMPTTAGAPAAAPAAAVGADSGKRSPVVRPPVVARAIEVMRERRGEMVDEERILPALVSQFGKEVRALHLHAACRACLACLACHLPHVPCIRTCVRAYMRAVSVCDLRTCTLTIRVTSIAHFGPTLATFGHPGVQATAQRRRTVLATAWPA